MDNRIFNVNGKGFEMLEATLILVFLQHGLRKDACVAWYESVKGLILLWCDAPQAANKLPVSMDASQIAPMVWKWLQGDFAKNLQLSGWDADADHDGDNSDGWRVYVEDWGHVGEESYSICAIKPAKIWHGK